MKLKNIAQIQTGFLFRTKIPEVANGNIRVVQMKDCSHLDGVNWDSCVKTSVDKVRDHEWLQAGDILIPTRGNHYQAVYIDQKIANQNALAAPHFFVIRTVSPNILPKYLFWWLNLHTSQKYFMQNTEGTITKSIRRPILENLMLKIPSLLTQQTIIRMAETLEQEKIIALKLIENNEQLMNSLAQHLEE